jgi:hypothetical protein
VYDVTSVDVAVANLNAIVQDTMEQTVSRGFISKKKKFPLVSQVFLDVLVEK